MKSFGNRRWADPSIWFNVPGGTRECCNTLGWPKVQEFEDFAELTAPIRD